MKDIQIIDRSTSNKEIEKVYGEKALAFLYSDHFLSNIFLVLISKLPFFSMFYGFLQKRKYSKSKISPFIKKYDINTAEFEKKVDQFTSFNDFFIRKLKEGVRPSSKSEDIAALPSDARYMVFQDINTVDGFYVKGKKFTLNDFLQDDTLANKYREGSMVIARLCPTDYHRFHFPVDCTVKSSKKINGYLYSVNPIAIRKNIEIYAENKREITVLETEKFGTVLYIEVGATNVGSIHRSFDVGSHYKKGEEKGYFSLGGSSVILLFEKNKIIFDEDLIANSMQKIETKALLGQSLGKSVS